MERGRATSKPTDLLSCCKPTASIVSRCPREVGSGASTEPTCCEAIPQHRAATSSPGDGRTWALLTFPHPAGKLRGQGGNETLRQCPSSELQRGFFFPKFPVFLSSPRISAGHQVTNVNFLNYMGIKAVT